MREAGSPGVEGGLTGPGIGGEDAGQVGSLHDLMFVHDVGDETGDVEETDGALAEAFDGDFVGCVEDGWQGSTDLAGAPCQAEGGETVGIGFLEGEGSDAGEVGGDAVGGGAFGISEGVLDGQAHVGRGHLGEDGAVDEFDHGMDDALGVDDDLDAVHADVEEPAGLDHFEAFVEEGGGVDGDLAAHDPGRVFEGLFEGDLGEGINGPDGPVTEGAATGGEPEVADGGRGFVFEALEDGGVFAVDGEDADSVATGFVHDDATSHDEDFLGGDGDVLAGADGGEGWGEACGADDGDEDDVGLGEHGEFEETGFTG